MAVKAKVRANAPKVSFRISFQWPIINSVNKTKSSETNRSEIFITFCTALIELNFNGRKNDKHRDELRGPSDLFERFTIFTIFLVFIANVKIFRDNYARTSSK